MSLRPLADATALVRLDVWLWAARFYKSRTLAKDAIDRGHVRVEGERAKPSKIVAVDQHIRLRQGWDELEVRVLAVSDQRRGAPEAQQLYSETADSTLRRQQARLLRQAAAGLVSHERPSKQSRRQIIGFKRAFGEDDPQPD